MLNRYPRTPIWSDFQPCSVDLGQANPSGSAHGTGLRGKPEGRRVSPCRTRSSTGWSPPGKLGEFVERAIPLASQSLIERLRTAGVDNLELFPAEVTIPGAKAPVRTHSAFNVLDVVEASVLKKGKDLPHVFYCDEIVGTLVDTTVKKAIEGHIPGIQFSEDWREDLD